MKKILILMAHPRKDSFCSALAGQYKEGAEASGAEVRFVNLIDLGFDLNLDEDTLHDNGTPENVKEQQENISWAEHIVIIHPVWWGTYPAVLKGYIDNVFEAGFAFKYESKYSIKKLLKGRSAHIIETFGAPWWAAKVMFGTPKYSYPGEKALKEVTLNFCGISPVKISRFDGVTRGISEETAKKYLEKAKKLGKKLK